MNNRQAKIDRVVAALEHREADRVPVGEFFWSKFVEHAARELDLKIIYHGCGNATPLYEDMIEAGIDCYNPIEAKAGLDVVELKRRFGTRLAWNGNLDVTVLASGDRDAIRREVLHKLNAAKGGGFIPQSDHSVPDNIAPADWVYALNLIREYGTYPLDLGEYDEPM